MVELFARICRLCRKEILLCRPCRNLTRYCSKECSQEARRESSRRAGAKYRARVKSHFRRQRRYRERRREAQLGVSNVTQQPLSAPSPSVSMITRSADKPSRRVARLRAEVIINATPVDHDRAESGGSPIAADPAGSRPSVESSPAIASTGTSGAVTARVIECLVPPTASRCARCGCRGYPASPRALGTARR